MEETCSLCDELAEAEAHYMLRPPSAVCHRYDCPHGKYERTIVRERAGFDDAAFEGVFLLDLWTLNASSKTSTTVSQVSGMHSGLGAPHKRCFRTTRQRILGH